MVEQIKPVVLLILGPHRDSFFDMSGSVCPAPRERDWGGTDDAVTGFRCAERVPSMLHSKRTIFPSETEAVVLFSSVFFRLIRPHSPVILDRLSRTVVESLRATANSNSR